MHFNNHICWYLDNTFCGSLHATHSSGFDIHIFMAILCLILWTIGFIMLLKQLVNAGLTIKSQVKRRKYRPGAAAEEALLNISDCLSSNKLVLLLLIICPVIYFDVIKLCFSCFDFEAVVAHELGHVLGFGHTDEFFIDNMMRPEAAVMNNSTCGNQALKMPKIGQDPGNTLIGLSSLTTDYVADCTGVSLDGGVRCLSVSSANSNQEICCSNTAFDRVPLDSIMYSLTTHQARPCLSQDDLDGLNHLYPSCNYARLEEPICIKSQRNIGYARVGLNIIIPFTIISALSQALFRWTFRHNSRKLLQKKWKLAGKFVTTQNAAALCMQAHFRRHSLLVNQFKREVYAIVLQSAFRGAISRRQLNNNPSFGTVAMAAHRDAQLQNATSHLIRASGHQVELAKLRAQKSSLFVPSSVLSTPRSEME